LTVEVQKCINCYIVNCYPYIAALDTSTAAPGLGRRRWQSLRLILALGVQVRGGEALPDKSVYSLFHPVPAEWMRELSTDLPDQTESPYTVDAGHLQLELDFLTATVDREQSAESDVRTTVWGVGPLNFKIGLLNQLDVQFVLDTHVHSRLEDRLAGTVEKASGLGDWQTRLKLNLWGNDGGRTALAVMPFVKWPLARSKLRNGQTEGGLIIPLAVELPRGWSLGLMTEFDFVVGAGGRRTTEFVNLATLGHELFGPLAAYVEFASVVSAAGDVAWLGQVDLGFTYAIHRNVRLDLGCNFGVTRSAPDYQPFLGLSWRY